MSRGIKGIRKTIFSAWGAVCFFAILILANILISNISFRIDATQDGLYSFSEGTHSILSELKQDVVIKVFYSKSVSGMPANIKTFAQRVLDFLSEYEHNGKGRIKIETYDPVLDSEEEEWAEKYGMKSIAMPTGEKIFLGMVAMAADLEASIPFIDPSKEANLEYDITRAISRVQTPDRLKIAIITSLPVFGAGPRNMGMPGQPQMEPWFFIEELKKTYEVKQLDINAETIDSDTNLVILFHPKGLSDATAYAVDQYVMKGGNLLAYIDPVSLMDDPRMGITGSSPDLLMKSWGVSLIKGKAVADYTYATKLRNRQGQIENNPLWLSTNKAAFNDKDIAVADLDMTLMPVAGAIEKLKESPYQFEPLISSSDNSALVDAFRHSASADELRQEFQPTGQRYVLAAKISGKFKTAFPDGKPEKKPSDDPSGAGVEETTVKQNAPFVKEAEKTATIMVIADTDLLFDGYYLRKQNFLGFDISDIFNDNLNLLLNMSEMLTGNKALIEIRSRGVFERPFTKVMALETKAQAKWLSREQELVRKVEATNEKLKMLEQQKDASQQAIMSKAQEEEIEKFQEEKRKISKELKIVRRNLRADIEKLGSTIKFLNIFLMPILISIGGIIFAIYRKRKVSS